jgi:ketosteroid isomerase-like protein
MLLLALPLAAAEPDPMQPVSGFVHALENADIDALLAVFADDATVFMPMPAIPRRLEGKPAIRDAFAVAFKDLLASEKKPPYFHLEPRDVQTKTFGDVALVTFHLGSATRQSSFSRRTFLLAKQDGRWRIVHLHASNVTIPPKP